MSKRRHRLSGRLLLLFVLAAVLLAVTVRTGFRLALDQNFSDLAQPHVAAYVQHLLDELGDPPTPERAAALAQRLPLRIRLSGDTNWSSDGDVPAFDSEHGHTHRLPDGTRVDVGRGRDGFAVRAQRGDTLIVLAPVDVQLADHARLALIGTIVAVLAILVLTYHAIRRLFRPIEIIEAGVSRIGSGDLRHRLKVRQRNELGELADSVNAMADDICDMLDAKRELLLAISHELRSPLTRARVSAELLDDSEPRRALLDDLGELEALLGELLESERLSGRHVALDRQAVEPGTLIRELVAEAFPDAAIALDTDADDTWISVDPVRVRLLVRNLLRNALAYTPSGASPPRLQSRVDDHHWRLTVTDQGPGVAPEQLARLTEPFYRADPSRQRASGGVGLGLYLCRIIAEAHGGELDIASTPGSGTAVRVRLPLDPA